LSYSSNNDSDIEAPEEKRPTVAETDTKMIDMEKVSTDLESGNVDQEQARKAREERRHRVEVLD